MKREIPVCKRCCFCVPLRYGLLVWGYFKMTADLFLLTISSYLMMRTIMVSRLYRTDDDYQSRIFQEMIVPVTALAVFGADFSVTILFIVGGHKKNVKLIGVFYFISITMWIFSFLLSAASVVLIIRNLILRNMHYLMNPMLAFSFYFLVLVVQMYFLILLRSEIIKLKDNGAFRFVNNAAEAECTMTCEEILAGGETERDSIRNIFIVTV